MADFNGSFFSASVATLTYTSPQASFVAGGSTPPVVAIYAQRVFSSGLNAWCSYIGPLDASPLPGATTPNWTGTISDYNITSRRLN